jgi:hypothetical protein
MSERSMGISVIIILVIAVGLILLASKLFSIGERRTSRNRHEESGRQRNPNEDA